MKSLVLAVILSLASLSAPAFAYSYASPNYPTEFYVPIDNDESIYVGNLTPLGNDNINVSVHDRYARTTQWLLVNCKNATYQGGEYGNIAYNIQKGSIAHLVYKYACK